MCIRDSYTDSRTIEPGAIEILLYIKHFYVVLSRDVSITWSFHIFVYCIFLYLLLIYLLPCLTFPLLVCSYIFLLKEMPSLTIQFSKNSFPRRPRFISVQQKCMRILLMVFPFRSPLECHVVSDLSLIHIFAFRAF